MKNANYNNALTNLEEEKEIKLLVKGLLESIDQLNNLESNNLLTEDKRVLLEVSLWDNVKYYLGKLGRYKAGGKILGKGKIDQEAGAKIQKIIDKKGNEFIQTLHQSIQTQNAKDKGEFPNNRDPEIFLNIVLSIAEVYDSIVAASKLKPNEEGYLPIDAANNIISDLREYVKKYLDVDVNWVSSIMDSEEESEEDVLITDSEEHINEDRAADVRAQLQAKGGDEEIENERMKTLKSWKLPLALMGAGASFGALSWLIEYIFPAEKITTYSPQQFQEIAEKTIGDVKPGDGFTQTLNSIPSLGTNLTPQSSPDEVINALSKIGGGDAQVGVDIVTQQGGVFRDPELAHQTLSELVKNPHGHGDTLKDVFKGDWAGTGKSAGDTLVTLPGGTIKMMMLKMFTRWVAKTVVKKSAIALFAGPILKTLGIGLLAAGALVKLFREKGKRQSRAKTLNDLLQSLQFVKGEGVLPPPPEPEPEPEPGPEPIIPPDFLQGNRNMQLAYLASNFLPKGQNLWNNLNLKEGTIIPSGFLDAALNQGKVDPEKYLKAFYKHLKKNDSFIKDINLGAWLTVVRSKKNIGLIKWIRNTRKSIGGFIQSLMTNFKEFEIGERQKAKVDRPGEKGQAMALAGESLNGRFDLLLELSGPVLEAGFDKNQFMKNLPQFMEMLSMMYYSKEGKPLPYNKQAVLAKCEEYGCKGGSGKKYKKTKHSDYRFIESNTPLTEELGRIKKLMK